MEPMSEAEAYATLCDARASQGWPKNWNAERRQEGWLFTSDTGMTYFVTDAGLVTEGEG